MTKLLPFRILTATLIVASACTTPSDDLYYGDCALYEDGVVRGGDVGIGSCLAGPTHLVWTADEGSDDEWLLVSNTNPFLDFKSGSLLAIETTGIPADGQRHLLSDLTTGSVDLPSFAGGMAYSQTSSLALVSSRYSDGARDRSFEDELVFVNLESFDAPSLATIGADSSSSLEVESDPLSVVWYEETGLAYVLNSSSGSVSVVDMNTSPVEVFDGMSSAAVEGVRFMDLDLSGSSVQVVSAEVTEARAIPSEDWTLTWVDGTTRLWIPTVNGIYNMVSHGDNRWRDSELGYELSSELSGGELSELGDPQLWSGLLGTRMAMSEKDSGDIYAATSLGSLSLWLYEESSLLEGRDGEWDESVSGPMVIALDGVEYLFYDGLDSSGTGAIGVATSTDGVNFARENGGEPALSLDGGRLADPHVIYDAPRDQWRMYFGIFDGAAWSIGHATSADLLNWSIDSDPVLQLEDDDGNIVSLAAPAVAFVHSEFRMWASVATVDGWAVGFASSVDGLTWNYQGTVSEIETEAGLMEPPGFGLQSVSAGYWGLSGALIGPMNEVVESGSEVDIGSAGWNILISEGSAMTSSGLIAGAENGVVITSVQKGEGRFFATVTDTDGIRRIADGNWNEGKPYLEEIVLEGREGSFDAQGVHDPVVFEANGEWMMLYAGEFDGLTGIGLATSPGGYDWTSRDGPVFTVGESWDSVSVVPGSVSIIDGEYTLWYTGSNGEVDKIGAATSTNGISWNRVGDGEALFAGGAPGEFDDSSVRDPYVVIDDTTEHLYYSGFDGDFWRIGYAQRSIGESEWLGKIGPVSDTPWPLLVGEQRSFDESGVQRPIVFADNDRCDERTCDDGFTMVYAGWDTGIRRVGLAFGSTPDLFYRTPRSATLGDEIWLSTEPGDDDDRESIRLDVTVDGFSTSGYGTTSMHLDADRGLIFISSASSSYIYVIDVRDDSTPSWTDNYHQLEAIMVANAASGAIGFRGVVAPSGSDWIYALNDNPESVMVFDGGLLEDNNRGDLHLEAVVGSMVAPRGSERDRGDDTLASIGPSELVMAGDYLFVTNFNANTVGVYDIRQGVYGRQVAEIEGVGENPHALAVSPDGDLLAVGAIVGDTVGVRASPLITIIDTETLEVIAWIANE
jgi:hypothetical protein